ncbi:Ger(x)C family spore germination protein [Bacillus sp. EAC]|uniref:Ger(x)C family spore germination protein n=1 Tax=Bacillus sp. EAC TaxID=1978338 RepID=UPI0015C4F359|nr:Ger(x)C family spore germination protein [Bacillus sp. EAC]
MRKTLLCLLSIFLIITNAGCNDKLNIEDLTMALLIGIDINDKDEVEMYIASPVFSEDAKEKSEQFKVTSVSIREARNYFDRVAIGMTTGGKVQSILIGSKVIEHEEWTSVLDLLFRDSKTRQNAQMVVVNGKVSDILNFSPKNKPRLTFFLPQLVDTANERNVAFRTSIKKYNQQNIDKGITPFLPELTLKEDLQITGTVLLDDKNVYKRTLSLYETQLLKILNGDLEGQLSMTMPIDVNTGGTKLFPKNRVSFYVQKIKKKIHKKYSDGHYQFDIKLKIPIEITESPVALKNKEANSVEKKIEDKLQNDLKDFINSLQQENVDPVGFGVLARSFKYNQWKKVENNWVKAFQQSKVKLNVKIIITDRGNII